MLRRTLRNRLRRGRLLLILLAVSSASRASAAELKSVQSGSVVLGIGSVSEPDTLTPGVDLTRSFLVFSVSGDDNDPEDFQVSGQITNSTTVTFARVGSASAVTVKWYVAEFLSGVRVKRGTANLDAFGAVDVDFSALLPAGPVSLTKSFPLVSARTLGTILDANDYVRAEITSTTNLRLEASTTGIQFDVEWQVVEYLDANVQRGTLTFGALDTIQTLTAPADFTAVNPAKTWLLYSHDSSAPGCVGCVGDRLIRGVVANGSTLTFERALSGPTANLTWYLVHFADDTHVQHASEAFTGAETVRNVPLASAALQRSIALGGFFMRGGSSPEALDDNPGVAWFTFDLTSSTNLRITRGTTGPGPSPADAGWFVVQFDCCTALSTTRTPSTITVTSANNFEMRFNSATGGGIDELRDLAEDSTVDLAGGTQGIETLFTDAIEIPPPGTWYDNAQNPSELLVAGSLPKLDLLEATPARVRVRAEAFYYQEGAGATILPSVKSWTDYSVYPSGRVGYRLERRTSTSSVAYSRSTLNLGVHLAGAPLASWTGYSQSGMLGSQPALDTFGLFTTDVAGARTDFLEIPHRDWTIATSHPAPATAWARFDSGGEEYGLVEWREFAGGSLPANTSESWDFLTYFKPTNLANNADAAVTARAADYRGPDPLSAIGPGAGWNENAADADFFNESEGVYTLELGATGLTFDMNGSTTTRHSPFFKIRQWRSFSEDPSVTLEGASLLKDLGYRAAVKPISRAHFTNSLSWHCTLQDAASCDSANIDVGGGVGLNLGSGAIVAGRHGNGLSVATVMNDSYFVAPSADFSMSVGAVDFWYKPYYDSGTAGPRILWSNVGGTVGDYDCVWLRHVGGNLEFRAYLSADAESCNTGGTPLFTISATSADYAWRAFDWVHIRTEWNNNTFVRLLVNGKVVGSAGGFSVVGFSVGNVRFGSCQSTCPGGGGSNNADGLIDEPHMYLGMGGNGNPESIAHGGLTSAPDEYLARGGLNFTLDFAPVDASRRGRYAFFGTDSKFRGLNVALSTPGTWSTAGDLVWEYWNGTTWAPLEGPGFTDETNHLTKANGAVYWTSDPAGWAPYSFNGGPDLYYVRVHLAAGGSYAVPPVEMAIKTDILLFQYCGDITAIDQTFVFALPPPTEVRLLSFDAVGSDGTVALFWETGSEVNNLGFQVYRSTEAGGPYARITSKPIPGLGSSPAGARYRYRDSGLVNGTTYFYKLEDIETMGKTTLHGPVSATPSLSAGSPPEPGVRSIITYGNPAANGFRVLERSSRGVVVELVTEGFTAEPQEDGSVRLEIPGFEPLKGSPSVPVLRPWVEAALRREVAIASIRETSVESFEGLRPSGAEEGEIAASRSGTVRARRGRTRKFVETEGLVPDRSARLLQVGFQGESKKAQLELAPLRWNGAAGELQLSRKLTVRLAFSSVRGRTREEKPSRRSRSVVARLVTTEAGLHEVSYEELFQGRRGGSSLEVKLTRLGEPVFFHIEPAGRRFGPGSRLYFVSEGPEANPYGKEAVYELERGHGLSMEVGSASPSGEPVTWYVERDEYEENRFYQAGLLEAPDIWLWDLLMAPVTKAFSFETEALASGPASLSVGLQGVSDFASELDHHVRLYVNGTFLDEVSWDGKTSQSVELVVPEGGLREGENQLEIENVGDTGAAYSMVMLDSFQVSYPRALSSEEGRLEGLFPLSGTVSLGLGGSHLLDVTEENPRWLSGGESSADGSFRFRAEAGRRYLAISRESVRRPLVRRVAGARLEKETLQADYLVIGPEAFAPAAAPLLQHRSRQGLRVKFASVEDVYSEFGFGEARPEAIREFLSYAYHHWREPKLRYVLLLGDATYDFKDYLGTGVRNQVPPLLVKTSYLWTVSDPALAAVNGEDILPDVAIGRLPAATAEELSVMVEKILAYERGEADLRGLVVLVNDNSDRAGDFAANAAELARGPLAGRAVVRLDVGELGAATRGEIVSAFDQGASLVSYIGHGGIHLWADENVFNTGDVDSLSVQPQQPLLLTLNCLNGYFHFPYFDSLAESLVKAEGKGAMAAFSPSGLSLNEPAHRFHQALLDELLHEGHERLGDAVLAAQERYASTGAFPELLSIYHLLGDPAMRIR